MLIWRGRDEERNPWFRIRYGANSGGGRIEEGLTNSGGGKIDEGRTNSGGGRIEEGRRMGGGSSISASSPFSTFSSSSGIRSPTT